MAILHDSEQVDLRQQAIEWEQQELHKLCYHLQIDWCCHSFEDSVMIAGFEEAFVLDSEDFVGVFVEDFEGVFVVGFEGVSVEDLLPGR